MALRGKHNVIALVRINKAPYWRLYHSEGKRQAGNFIDQADFSDANLDLENSLERLRSSLDMLTTGTYLLIAFQTKDKSKGGIDTIIEIEGSGNQVAAVGSVGIAGFHIDGFGAVTPDNFNEAIESKMKKMLDEQQRAADFKRLQDENAAMKKELQESEGGFKRGIISIGSVLYDNIKETPSGKEFIGMAQKVFFGMNAKPAIAGKAAVNAIGAKAAVNGASDDPGNQDDDRLAAAIEGLADNNPEWLGQLEQLARLKKEDPSTFEMAVDSLKATT